MHKKSKDKFSQKEVPCMKITSSYQVEILSNTDMKNTVQIYRRALAFVVDVCNKEWVDISSIESQVQKKKTTM